MMEHSSYAALTQELQELAERFHALRGIFDVEEKKQKFVEVERELSDPGVWNNPDKAKALSKERSELNTVITSIEDLEKNLQHTTELCALAEKDFLEEVASEVRSLHKSVEQLEFRRMFNGELDASDSFLDIQSGAGGTEAQDWANILLRMYLRWGERRGFKTEILSISDGEVAGIKNATVQFEGPYAYGWLRTETGIHRLVRKSPFNAAGQRHTSFASVFVYPSISEDIQVDINPADLKVDTYRAGGAGGQHVNKTDSAIRITHMPTGIVVQCQSDRSQHKNRAYAMKQLKAKLYELELSKRDEKRQQLEDTKSDIGWGNQIRSYVLDQSRIKDLRTGVEVGDTTRVLDGDIDMFLEASLKGGV